MSRCVVPSESEEKGPGSPASSFLSEAFDGEGEPPPKRRRVSYSSLSSDSDLSSDDEEKPLAASRAEPPAEKPQKSPVRNGKGRKGGKVRGKAQQRAGKSMASMKSKGHTAPAHKPPPTEAERAEMERPTAPNGAAADGVAVKVEDKMDEGQLSRLVTGVTVDAGAGATSATVSGAFVALWRLSLNHALLPQAWSQARETVDG